MPLTPNALRFYSICIKALPACCPFKKKKKRKTNRDLIFKQQLIFNFTLEKNISLSLFLKGLDRGGR
jgi:hypothetical protein